MISYAKFAAGYNADMEAMCEECMSEFCCHHGGDEEPCDDYRSAEDAYEDYAAEEAEYEREEKIIKGMKI